MTGRQRALPRSARDAGPPAAARRRRLPACRCAAAAAGGYPGCVDVGRAVAVRTRHRSRPGRRVIVAADLASLCGPAHGTVTLPLWLYWSGPSPVFDLDEPFLRQWLYQIVLREAASPQDLTSYLRADLLVAVWPQLHLPKGVRRAWEELHPQLRSARPAASA